MRLRLSDYFVFELGQYGKKFRGFEGLDNKTVRPHTPRFVRFERFQLAYGQEDWNPPGLRVFLHSLAYFQASVARHIHIEHNQVRFVFRDFLERCRAVVDRNDFIAGVREDAPPHVLGSHAVVGKQYSSRQEISFDERETA